MRFRRISIHLAVVAAATATVAVFAAEPQTAPRTEWGDPDLRGLWSNATVTPMERPDALGDKTACPTSSPGHGPRRRLPASRHRKVSSGIVGLGGSAAAQGLSSVRLQR